MSAAVSDGKISAMADFVRDMERASSTELEGKAAALNDPTLEGPPRSDAMTLQGRPAGRLLAYLLRAGLGGLLGFAGTALFIQHVLGVVPGERGLLLIFGSAAGMLAGLAFRPRFGCRRIDIGEGRLLLTGPKLQATLGASDVEVLIGEKRANLDGGEVLRWETIWLVTSAGRFAFHVHAADARSHYAVLMTTCPSALAVDPDGNILLMPGEQMPLAGHSRAR